MSELTELEQRCNQLAVTFGSYAMFFLLLPILVALFRWKSLNKSLKIFFWFCVATLGLNLLELSYVHAVNNYTDFFMPWLKLTNYSLTFLFILYQIKNFAFLGWFFSDLLKKYDAGSWIKWLSIGLIVSSIIAYVLEEGWRNFGVFGPTTQAIYLFIIPFFYLWYLFKNTLAIPIVKNPYFWISIGLITPNLIGLFHYFMADTLEEIDICLLARFTIAKNCFEIIGQILLCIGFWRATFAKYLD